MLFIIIIIIMCLTIAHSKIKQNLVLINKESH